MVDHTADKMILTFLQIFSKLGIPNIIHCDRRSNFLSKTFQQFCTNLTISPQFEVLCISEVLCNVLCIKYYEEM